MMLLSDPPATMADCRMRWAWGLDEPPIAGCERSTGWVAPGQDRGQADICRLLEGRA